MIRTPMLRNLPAALALAAVAFGATTIARPAGAAEPGPAVFVVDGSGSVWGNFEGTRDVKFYATRDGLISVLGKLPPTARMGLVSFGHRRKGDCSDVELVVPPDAGQQTAMTDAIAKLNPRGKGPLTAGLNEAARAIGPGNAGTIVLVHDGADNCQQDVCQAATEIAKSNPGLPVHVIGLGLDKADAQRMQCVTKATGGRFFPTRDKASLDSAIAETVKLTGLDHATAPAAAAATAKPEPQPADSEGPPSLRLTASLSRETGIVEMPVKWRVSAEGSAATVPLFERETATLSEPIAPGKYDVEARLGHATARTKLAVGEKGVTAETIVLDAGTLRLGRPEAQGSDHRAKPIVTITALAEKDGSPPEVPGPPGTVLWMGRDPADAMILPAGHYRVVAENGIARRMTDVGLAAGAEAAAEVALATGRLELAAVAQAGASPLAEVLFLVAADDPDAPEGRREIARSAAPKPDFTLAAGTYYVTARAGKTEVRERVAVSTGGLVRHTIVLGLAKLAVAVAIDPSLIAPGATMSIDAFKLDGETAVLTGHAVGGAAEFLVGQGRYRIVASIPGTSITAVNTIDMAAGRDQRIVLQLEPAQLTVKPPASFAGSRKAFWEVRDAKGRVVLRSGRADTKTGSLPPGRYKINAEQGEQRLEREIDLKPAEKRSIDLGEPPS